MTRENVVMGSQRASACRHAGRQAAKAGVDRSNIQYRKDMLSANSYMDQGCRLAWVLLRGERGKRSEVVPAQEATRQMRSHEATKPRSHAGMSRGLSESARQGREKRWNDERRPWE
jgi:hypothetical protein